MKKNKGCFTLSTLKNIFRTKAVISASVIIIIVLLVLYLVLWMFRNCSMSIKKDTSVALSPTVISYMKEIGQWEFLSVTDEELVDTVKYGFFGDDSLMRIYYGTLRFGIDMSDVQNDWIQVKQDTVFAVLPPIKLLDDDFIDEARTKSFYQQGSWKATDYAAMYEKAKVQMKQRCYNKDNIKRAEGSATKQFFRLLTTMGFDYVKVTIKENEQTP